MIAATDRAHGVSVVTRNVRDFEPAGIEVVNIPLSRLVERTCLVNNSLHRSILFGVGPCIKLLWI